MERSLLIALLAFCFSLSGNAQENPIEKLMVRNYVPCQDVIYNSSILVPEYYAAQKIDTVQAILDYWELHCGLSEPLLRIKILLAIEGDSLQETIYRGQPIINTILYFRQNNDTIQNAGEIYYGRHAMNDLIHPDFNRFTRQLADSLSHSKISNNLEAFFLDLYALKTDSIFNRLQDSSLAGTRLQKDYNFLVSQYIDKPEGHYAVYSGLWIPHGNMDLLGVHPIFGMKGGVKFKRLLLDLALEFKFGRAANSYLVQKSDSIYTTDYFFGGYVGLETGYELFQFDAHEIDILAGVGFEGIDVLSIGKSTDDDYISKSINTANLNLGLGYRFYLRNKSYLGFEARYNFVDYDNEDGTDLSGNTVLLRLKYGISRRILADKALNRLQHKSLVKYPEKYRKWLDNPLRYRGPWYY